VSNGVSYFWKKNREKGQWTQGAKFENLLAMEGIRGKAKKGKLDAEIWKTDPSDPGD